MSLFLLFLIIGFSSVIILNMIFSFSWQTAFDLFNCFAVTMLPAGIILFVGRILPRQWFSSDRAMFKVNRFEKFVCKVTNVKSWKDKIPVGGHVAGFSLKHLTNPNDINYLDRYIYESCFAEWLHYTIFFWCFISMLILPKHLFFNMVLPITILFAFQNKIFVIIQWFTRPRIARIYDNLIKRKNSQNNIEIESDENPNKKTV